MIRKGLAMEYKNIIKSLGIFAKSEKADFKSIRDDIKCGNYHCDGTR
jgi:hypothetical protein